MSADVEAVADVHGTYGREQQHRLAGEQPCDAYREAARVYTAQRRARQRLVDLHPALYKALYAEEKAKAEREVAL